MQSQRAVAERAVKRAKDALGTALDDLGLTRPPVSLPTEWLCGGQTRPNCRTELKKPSCRLPCGRVSMYIGPDALTNPTPELTLVITAWGLERVNGTNSVTYDMGDCLAGR